MKVKRQVKIESMNHEDLVDFLSTALTGSTIFGVDYDSDWYDNLPDAKKEGDCIEDALADILLNGGKIKIIDLYADGEKYGNLSFSYVDRNTFEDVIPLDGYEDGYPIAYDVTLEDVIEGIECACNSDQEYIRDAANDLIDDEGMQFDLADGEVVLQMVVFGEVIYG